MANDPRTPLLTPEELETARLRLWTMTYDQPPSRAAVERMHEHALALSAALAEAQQERDAYKRDFEAELDGNATLRQKHGARDDETMFTFLDRLSQENARLKQEIGDLNVTLLQARATAATHCVCGEKTKLEEENTRLRAEGQQQSTNWARLRDENARLRAERDEARGMVTRHFASCPAFIWPNPPEWARGERGTDGDS